VHALMIINGPVINGERWQIEYQLTSSPIEPDPLEHVIPIYVTIIPGFFLMMVSLAMFEIPVFMKKQRRKLHQPKKDALTVHFDESENTVVVSHATTPS
jgi:hypothetical protein